MSEQPRVPCPGLYKNAYSEGKGLSEEVVYLEAGAPYPLGWTEQPADEWVLLEKQDVMVRHITEPLAHLPADTNVGIKVLRRYMDYWKYKDLVRRGAIYMSTAEQLHDSDATGGATCAVSGSPHRRGRPQLSRASGHDHGQHDDAVLD